VAHSARAESLAHLLAVLQSMVRRLEPAELSVLSQAEAELSEARQVPALPWERQVAAVVQPSVVRVAAVARPLVAREAAAVRPWEAQAERAVRHAEQPAAEEVQRVAVEEVALP